MDAMIFVIQQQPKNDKEMNEKVEHQISESFDEHAKKWDEQLWCFYLTQALMNWRAASWTHTQ